MQSAAFAGTYAIAYLRSKGAEMWNIQDAARRGVKASALKVLHLGSREAIPWADEIEAFRETPLFESFDNLVEVSQKTKKGDLGFLFQRTKPEEK